jgi:hypothetical protein
MSWDKVEKDVESGPGGLFKWILIAIILFALLFGVLRWTGMIGETLVQRTVFENSYQYKKGQEQRGAMLEAQLMQIEASIVQSSGDARQGLIAQKKVIEAQLMAVRIEAKD